MENVVMKGKEKINTELHTAVDVNEDQSRETSDAINEVAYGSNREGRNGSAQSALGLGQKTNKASSASTANEIFRISVTAEAEQALNELVDKANRNFTGGKINRTEMVSWALVRFNRTIDDAAIQEIRSEHFDEVAALEALWRRAKEKGRVSDDIKQLLLKEIGFEATPKKRQSKA